MTEASRSWPADEEREADRSEVNERNAERRVGSGVFSRFYRNYFSKFVADLRSRYGNGPPEPEEVAQQAFANLSQHGDLDSIRSLERFVWVSARNIIISESRKAGVRDRNAREIQSRFYGRDVDEFDPERVSITREELSLVMDALKTLPAKSRRMFLLNRVHGLAPAEIARRFGVRRTTVVYHIGKVAETLYRQLGDASTRDEST